MNILVSGSLAYDRIMDFPGKFSDHILPDKVHVLNVCFMINELKENFGGTAGNIAYALSQLDESPTIVATAGRDFDSYKEWFGKNNISTDNVKIIDDELTAGAYITTDQSDNQITAFNPGAMKFGAVMILNPLHMITRLPLFHRAIWTICITSPIYINKKKLIIFLIPGNLSPPGLKRN